MPFPPRASSLVSLLRTAVVQAGLGAMLGALAQAETMAEFDAHTRERDRARIVDETSKPNQQWYVSPTGSAPGQSTPEYIPPTPEQQAALDEQYRHGAEVRAERERSAAEAAERAQQGRERHAARVVQLQRQTEQAITCLAAIDPESVDAATQATIDQQARALEEAAEEGNVQAKAAYGWMTVEAVFVKPEADRGRRLLQEAAANDERSAMFHLGYCLQHGLGGPVDLANARKWYRAAAARETPDRAVVRRLLGAMDEAGLGARADLSAAISWYRQAAADDDRLAMLRLAEMEHDGIGMPADEASAVATFGDIATGPDSVARRIALACLAGGHAGCARHLMLVGAFQTRALAEDEQERKEAATRR